MPDTLDADHLTPEQWEQLVALPDRVESAWAGGGPVNLVDLLPSPEDGLRRRALQEAVRTDLAIRYRRGEPIRLEAYREMFPELGEPGTMSAQMVLEEYRARRRAGETPSLEEYRSRFPEQFPEVQRLVEEEEKSFATMQLVAQASSSNPLALGSDLTGAPTREPDRAKRAGPARPSLPDLLRDTIGYELIEEIGRGSFAEVWRARAPGQVEVAVKVILRPVSDKEAQRELHSLERTKDLRHPYLLRTHAYWLIEGRLVIAMELADNSLKARQQECQRQGLAGVPLDELLLYARETAEAIDFLHHNLVHHGDIKPANILLTGGHVQLADFGLARVLAGEHSITATGSGTPVYMAPEVWRGRFSPNSDQYSLAATYVELRLGRRMFEAQTSAEILLAHLSLAPDLRGLPAPEQQILLRALSKEATARYSNCLAFANALYRAAGREPGGFMPRQQAPGPHPAPAPPQAAGAATEMLTDASRAPAAATVISRRPRPRSRLWRPLAQILLLLTLGFAGYVVWFVFLQGRAVLVPLGWERTPDAALVTLRQGNWRQRLIGADFPAQIARTTPAGRLELSLVTPEGAPPFHVLPRRVTNAQFLSFARAKPEAVRPVWHPDGELAEKAALAPAAPVMGIAWREARACAAWLGGELPTSKQLGAAYTSGVCLDTRLPDADEWFQPNPRPDLRDGLPTATFRIVAFPPPAS